jgi:hypothetical protein
MAKALEKMNLADLEAELIAANEARDAAVQRVADVRNALRTRLKALDLLDDGAGVVRHAAKRKGGGTRLDWDTVKGAIVKAASGHRDGFTSSDVDDDVTKALGAKRANISTDFARLAKEKVIEDTGDKRGRAIVYKLAK